MFEAYCSTFESRLLPGTQKIHLHHVLPIQSRDPPVSPVEHLVCALGSAATQAECVAGQGGGDDADDEISAARRQVESAHGAPQVALRVYP